MEMTIAVLIALVLAVVAYRQWLLRRSISRHHAEVMDATVYPVGSAAVVERGGESPRATVICIHGFCEDLRYFTGFYADPGLQLILLMSGDYHLPLVSPEYVSADWVRRPAASEGSIAYDAMVLTQALEHLPRTGRVRVHGHSRGGAVVLEAAALRPELFRDVEVILEAPVLPGARQSMPESRVALWFMPFLVELWRRAPITARNAHLWGPLENPRKRELITGLPFNPRRIRTIVANFRDIAEWMRNRNADLYRNVFRGVILMAGEDRILDTAAMEESASKAGDRLELVMVEGASHFILLDRPEAVPAPFAERRRGQGLRGTP